MHSSPYRVSSRSTSIHSSVSPSRTRSPTVGPNMLAYVSRLSSYGGIRVESEDVMAEGSGEWEKPREMRFERALDERERSAKCLVKVVLRRRLPPGKARESERPSDSCPSTESRTSARRRTRHDLVACDLDERDRLGVTWLEADGRARCNVEALEEGPVSYTHLTLPTIYSV